MRLLAKNSLTEFIFVPWPTESVKLVSLSNSFFEVFMQCFKVLCWGPTVQPTVVNYKRESFLVISQGIEGS